MRIKHCDFFSFKDFSKDSLLLFTICCVFFIINAVSPIRCDDLIYQYHWQEERVNNFGEPIDLNDTIDNIAEAFNSQINHYMVMNGRFIVHFIVQCFCGFLGKPFFNIVNTLVFYIFYIGCLRLIGFNIQEKKIFAISTLWLALPILHIFYYSISFSVNYLWASTSFIYLLIILKKAKVFIPKNESIFHLFALFLCCALLSSFHEGFSLPLCGVLFVYICKKRNHTSIRFIACATGVLIGSLFLTLAPGIIERGSSSLASPHSLLDLFYIKLDVIWYSKRFFIFFIYLLFQYSQDKDYVKTYLRKRSFEIGFILFDLCFVFAVPTYSQRMSFPYEMLSTLLLIELLTDSIMWNKVKKIACITMVLIMVIQLPFVIYYAQKVSKEYSCMMKEYQESPKGIAHFQTYSIPKPINPYVRRFDKDIERDYISFTQKKEMIIE